MTELTIPLRSHEEANLVLGPYDRHAKLLHQALEVEIFTRNGNLRIRGGDRSIIEARRRVEHLLGKLRKGRDLDPTEIERILAGDSGEGPRGPGAVPVGGLADPSGGIGSPHAGAPPTPGPSGAPRPRARAGHASGSLRGRAVEPRTRNQRLYLEAIEEHDLTFGIGVAGTGKTFLAVAAAVRALRAGLARRLVITRPVVEAGEKLGFLPGDVQAKLNPYMRPIYDALYGILGFEDVNRLEDAGVIEVAPLAYMRGRTLSSSFVILDEAQNTTVSQMKMFLTRLGEESRMVVTGDPSQSDLPQHPVAGSGGSHGTGGGLLDACRRLRGFEGVGIVEFGPKDIVRHPLVEAVLKAYEKP